jgi:hypothetical protein
MTEAKEKPIEHCLQPSLSFQAYFDLEGIGNNWIMPEGKSLAEMETQLWKEGAFSTSHGSNSASQHRTLPQYYADTFLKLNPELHAVELDRNDPYEVRHFIHGVVSGFNADDIKDWISRKPKHVDEKERLIDRFKAEFDKAASQSWYPSDYRDMVQLLLAYGVERSDSTCPMSWMPSLHTIESIHRQCDEKDAAILAGQDIAPPPRELTVEVHRYPLVKVSPK